MSATETAHEAASTAARRRRRGSRAAAALAVATLALGGLIAASSAAKPLAVHASLAAAGPSTTLAPMIPGRARARRSTKARIGLFTATPAQLPAAGGKVRLLAVVQGAKSCSFSLKALARAAATKPCGSGNVSLTVTLPRNGGSAAREFHFRLTATGPHSSTSAGPVEVTELAPGSSRAAPKITTQPTGRSVGAGASVTFTAAATGSSSTHWQVSSDGGLGWADVPGANSPSYSFTATAADSGNEYRAVFANSRGSTTTQPATLIVSSAGSPPGGGLAQIAPAVTTQPASVSVTAGAGVTFTAAASGSPAPSVQWQISTDGGNSWADIAGAAGSSYTLTAQLAASGYLYRAAFVNAAGTAYSNAATLNVAAPLQGPSLTTQPQSQSVLVGQSVTFTATADGSPTPSVQWQYSTDGGNTWTAIPGATSTSYSIASTITAESGWEYEAVFTSSNGVSSSSVTSSVATLTVATQLSPPSVNVQPANTTVVAGNVATFTAGAAGTPTPAVQWQYSTNSGSTWTPLPGDTSTTLMFSASSGQNGYEYEAVFTNGSGTAISNPAMLTVQTPPAVTGQPSPSAPSVIAGASVSLSASASGTPTPTIQWQQSTNGGGTWTNIVGATSSPYSFTSSTAENNYQYRAVFTNAAGSATSNAATLSVVASAVAPQITGQPAKQVVVASYTASFSASASGSPTPTVQWMVSVNGGSSWSMVTGAGATSSTYSFTASGSENGYEYEAVFTNAGGNATSAPATLVVGGDTVSTNWSGYVSTGADGSFTMVTGSWTVPTATCTTATSYSSMWIGIDGYGNSTVEQDGTDSDCSGSAASYFAWIEMYGDNADSSLDDGSSVELPDAVSAGDSMNSTISYSSGQWTLAISDLGPGHTWSSSTPVTWDASSSASPEQLSAEWVVERPEICNEGNCNLATLTNFGTAGFSGASATKSGTTKSLYALSPMALQMSASSSLLALPASLAPGASSFTDTFYNSN